MPTASNGVQHVGKFRALWAWLRDQPGAELPVTFDEIEEIIGTPLPRSWRTHPAHWSSYEGSAVARAIQDAGWTAQRSTSGGNGWSWFGATAPPPTTVNRQHATSAESGLVALPNSAYVFGAPGTELLLAALASCPSCHTGSTDMPCSCSPP